MFPVWKTIKIGTLKTAVDFRKALKKSGIWTNFWAMYMLRKPGFTTSEAEMELDLVVVTVADLMFGSGMWREFTLSSGAHHRDIIAKALELGLELCPAEVGPQLRLQYTDQPKGEQLIIGMESITGSDGYSRVFHVNHDKDGHWSVGRLLFGALSRDDYFWDRHYKFVFVRPR